MREAPVAIEKNAVERAIRPAWRPGAGSAIGSSPGSNASARRIATSSASGRSALIGRSSNSWISGASGLTMGFQVRGRPANSSVAIVGGRPQPARRPLGL